VVASMQARYADDTGVKGLKIRHNNVLGYFVEVTAQHGDKLMSAPLNATVIHRQTLAHRSQHGRQVDLPAPERADRPARADRQLRAGHARPSASSTACSRASAPPSEAELLIDAVKALHPDEMSPREALDALYALKAKLPKQ
jgi:DNA mismatch repair ATPase MutS